ncbi:DNA polymerase III subunit beta family protein [Antrihabitans cavernicola]|uniref:DNA polymerase III subunit beta family protein n=1 Tax=Antrihabitans cavernicola TaxID=2495913 RepID=UPI0016599B72|nr:MerR family transcriptional regulator [Spelaeibacter cavernicola]
MADELMTVGVFAQLSGMTPSALRFYGDSGVLTPVETDSTSGYRYYSAAQVRAAILIRHLRDMGLPLADVKRVLNADTGEAQQLVVAHVSDEESRLARTKDLAERAIGLLAVDAAVSVSGVELARAVVQVAAAIGTDPAFPILAGVFVEICDGALILTATDRYRLSTRTLPSRNSSGSAAAVVGTADLVAAIGEREVVTIAIGTDVHVDGQPCRVIEGEFPDYRVVFAGLAEPVYRIVRPVAELLASMQGRATLTLDLTADGSTRIHFDTETLGRALTAGIGPDVMLDISAPDRPVVVRSATDGDFTTLVMPRRSSAEPKGREHV